MRPLKTQEWSSRKGLGWNGGRAKGTIRIVVTVITVPKNKGDRVKEKKGLDLRE